MKVRLGWLLGSVTARVTGPGQGEFLNRCAALGADLWTMERLEGDELLVRAPGRAAPLLRQAAAESLCRARSVLLRRLARPARSRSSPQTSFRTWARDLRTAPWQASPADITAIRCSHF